MYWRNVKRTQPPGRKKWKRSNAKLHFFFYNLIKKKVVKQIVSIQVCRHKERRQNKGSLCQNQEKLLFQICCKRRRPFRWLPLHVAVDSLLPPASQILARLLCPQVFFIDWPFKSFKPTAELITLSVPPLQGNHQSRRILLFPCFLSRQDRLFMEFSVLIGWNVQGYQKV